MLPKSMGVFMRMCHTRGFERFPTNRALLLVYYDVFGDECSMFADCQTFYCNYQWRI